MECRTILIKIHRRRLFEDGFQHIKSIADDVLKHHVKIMFVNELGKLDSLGGAHPKKYQKKPVATPKSANWHCFFGFFLVF